MTSTRGEKLDLNEDELAFYDALEANDSAAQCRWWEMRRSGPSLRSWWRLSGGTRPIDWTVRESVRAEMRNAVRRVLRKHGYPPDKQDKAVETVTEQAELLSEEWAHV